MRKFFYFLLAAVTMTLAACGGDGENGAYLKNFKVEISNLTETKAEVKVTAADESAWFDFEIMKAEEFFQLSAEELHAKIDAFYKFAKFPEFVHQKEFVRPYKDLEPGTDYVVYIYQEDEYYHIVGDVEWKIFKTSLPIEGSLKGRFTINPQGDQIVFSKGNLQYNAMQGTYKTPDGKEIKGTWRFAINQWDFVGDAEKGNVFENGVQCSNNKISDSYSGWIDLFGWGTGNAPTKSSTSEDDYPDFVNWGNNPISNGGNQANMWRTLDEEEWDYLFCKRTDAAKLFTLGKVNGVNGAILLPDNWSGEKFDNAADGLVDKGGYYYNPSGNYSRHSYTKEQWETDMEPAGAVFLPAAGDRYGTNMDDVGREGNYWSVTPFDWQCAYSLRFQSVILNPQHSSSFRYIGRSVRLVR